MGQPLLVAVQTHDRASAKLLLAQPKIDLSSDAESSLWYAIVMGLDDIVVDIIHTMHHRSQSIQMQTVHMALRRRRMAVVDVLMDLGIRVDSKAIGLAVREGFERLPQLLTLATPSEINQQIGPSRLTPVLIAVLYGRMVELKLLLQHGGNIGGKDDKGNDALCLAAIGGHLEVVKSLVEDHGFSMLRSTNQRDQTPLQLAMRFKKQHVRAYLESLGKE
jgi:hypothetical protein